MAGETQENPYSVSDLTSGLKSAIERGFSRIYVKGEISGWRLYPSGHAYFTLKDGQRLYYEDKGHGSDTDQGAVIHADPSGNRMDCADRRTVRPLS